ncbi:hypothetical protein EVAR_54137_1 [Eumeta japonica]|uniref:Uncharacterized protein n=1 Tax=Eumeta variegata TaxID=151549 RepID=A0A4C1Z1C2_EUMVA|nr:hypothetical protein EVAR_54137_1 [Eumeta japonica]
MEEEGVMEEVNAVLPACAETVHPLSSSMTTAAPSPVLSLVSVRNTHRLHPSAMEIADSRYHVPPFPANGRPQLLFIQEPINSKHS